MQKLYSAKSSLLVADMVILGRRRFNARGLTSVVQSAAELKFADEGLMDKISQNLLTRMDKLDAIEVTDLVRIHLSFSLVNHSNAWRKKGPFV